MAGSFVRGVRPHPKGVSWLGQTFGNLGARLLGWGDGWLSQDRITPELDKFKERGELGGRHAEHWWAEVTQQLDGEIAALAGRLEDASTTQSRVEREQNRLATTYGTTRDSHDEARMLEKDSELDRWRREQREVRDRLERARAERAASYRMARAAAEAFKDHYEAMMKSYCAANRKARNHSVPVIELPEPLRAANAAPADAPAVATAAE